MQSYYYSLTKKSLRFVIPPGKNILYYGNAGPEILRDIKPAEATCILDPGITTMNASEIYQYVYSGYQGYVPVSKFDCVVLDFTIGEVNDICLLLSNVSLACTKHTRIIIHQENYLWENLLKLAARLGIIKNQNTLNWLSVKDVSTYLKALGFEATRTYRKTICPARLLFIGPLLNTFFSIFPIIDFLKLDEFIIARHLSSSQKNYPESLTVCITVKDEEKNIEPIVKSLPVIADKQEIVFVEGHSRDNTAAEIIRVQKLYPEKNIRLITQPGRGQCDAIRTGFSRAEGDIIILYEGDGTSDPMDICYVYSAMKEGVFEFIEGSRLVYPINSESMPFINKTGNLFFAKWFGFFLNQRATDVLSGIKAIRKQDFDIINQTWGFTGVEDPFGDFELLFGSVRYGLKIGELPIHYKQRSYGVSKTNALRHGWFLLKMAIAGYIVFRRSRVSETLA